MRQVRQDGFPGRQVDVQVVPFRRRHFGDAPLHEGLARGDELNDGRPAGLPVGLDRADERRAFHGCQEMPEEPLLGALERGQGGGLGVAVERALLVGDAGALQGLFEMRVDDLERVGVGIVDPALLVGEGVLQQFDFHPVVGQRPGLVEPERLQIAGDDFHGGDAAGLHRRDEVGALLERRLVGAPEPEALGVGQALQCRGAGGGDVQHPGVRQRVLQAQPRAALPGGGDVAA